MKKYFLIIISFWVVQALTACGFHPQGAIKLSPSLYHLYLQTSDPYSYLARTLKDYLKMSDVKLANHPAEADTILNIISDEASQEFLSVNGTQQTRQYRLKVVVTFEVADNKGKSLTGLQALKEERVITVQSNQILGSSNEATLFYQQMRRELANAIMNRLASAEISRQIKQALVHPTS